MSIKLANQYLEKDAIRAPNFFNGRLLSAEDLSADRAAHRRMLAQLGRARGHGVAEGLEVTGALGGTTASEPIVSVSAGLAFNREGVAVELNRPVEVSLLAPEGAPSAETSGANDAGAFGACGKLSTSVYAAGKGVYLLTIAPSQGREGRAMASGLGNLTACCADKSVVEGVQFRLIRLEISAADLNDPRLRNRLAHRCFGSSDAKLGGVVANPFGVPPDSYGLLDELRNGRLEDREVPLALIYWVSGEGTRFIDQWAVRRRLVRADDFGRWSALFGDRRAAEQEAMFLQFEAQVAGLSMGSPQGVRAPEHFDFLPAAGVLPVVTKSADVAFDHVGFFQGLKVRDQLLYVEGARVRWLLRMALEFPPIDLAKERERLIWRYLVRENRQASAAASGPQAYLIFVRGDVPYVADPHYDVHSWNFANFALNGAGTP